MVYSLLANSPCLWCLWNSFCCFVSNIAGTWISLNLSKMMLDEHRTLREFFYYLFLSSLFFYSFRILIQFLLVLKKTFCETVIFFIFKQFNVISVLLAVEVFRFVCSRTFFFSAVYMPLNVIFECLFWIFASIVVVAVKFLILFLWTNGPKDILYLIFYSVNYSEKMNCWPRKIVLSWAAHTKTKTHIAQNQKHFSSFWKPLK